MLREQATEISAWPHRKASIESVGIQNYQAPQLSQFPHFKNKKKTKKNRLRKPKDNAATIDYLKSKPPIEPKLIKKKGNYRPQYPTCIASRIRNIQDNLTPDPSIDGKIPLRFKKANKQNKNPLNHPQPATKHRARSQKQALSLISNKLSTLNLYDKLHNEIEYRSRSFNSRKIISQNPKKYCEIKQIIPKGQEGSQKEAKCVTCGKSMESGSKVAILTQKNLKRIEIDSCPNCVFEKKSRHILKQQKQFSVYLRKKYKASRKYHHIQQASNKLLHTIKTSHKQISPNNLLRVFSISKQQISLPFCYRYQKNPKQPSKSIIPKNQRISRMERTHSLKINNKYVLSQQWL